MSEPTAWERRRWARVDRRWARRRAHPSRPHPIASGIIGAVVGAPVGVLVVHLIPGLAR